MLTELEYTHMLDCAEEGKPLPIVLKQLVLQGNDLVFAVEVAPAKPFSETIKTQTLNIKAKAFSRFADICSELTACPRFSVSTNVKTLDSNLASECAFFFTQVIAYATAEQTIRVSSYLKTLLCNEQADS